MWILFFFFLLTLERGCHKATAIKLQLSESFSISEDTMYFDNFVSHDLIKLLWGSGRI